MSVYVPSPYMVQIRRKKKADRTSPYSTVDQTIETNFQTWEEARDWLVLRYENQVKRVKEQLQREERGLKRARSLVAPSLIAKLESSDGGRR